MMQKVLSKAKGPISMPKSSRNRTESANCFELREKNTRNAYKPILARFISQQGHLDVEPALLLPALRLRWPLIADVNVCNFSLPSTAFCHSSRADSSTAAASRFGTLFRKP
jgi:hypothetical protein